MENQNTFEVVQHIDALVRRMGNELDQIVISLTRREAQLVAFNAERGDYSVHSFYWWKGEALPNSLCYGHYDCNHTQSRDVLRLKAQHMLGGVA